METQINIVTISREELDEIKSMLKEILETLRLKEQAEINGQWIESTDARKMLGVSSRTFQSMRDRRIIPFTQFGRKIYVRRADLEDFMMKHYNKAEPKQAQERNPLQKPWYLNNTHNYDSDND